MIFEILKLMIGALLLIGGLTLIREGVRLWRDGNPVEIKRNARIMTLARRIERGEPLTEDAHNEFAAYERGGLLRHGLGTDLRTRRVVVRYALSDLALSRAYGIAPI